LSILWRLRNVFAAQVEIGGNDGGVDTIGGKALPDGSRLRNETVKGGGPGRYVLKVVGEWTEVMKQMGLVGVGGVQTIPAVREQLSANLQDSSQYRCRAIRKSQRAYHYRLVDVNVNGRKLRSSGESLRAAVCSVLGTRSVEDANDLPEVELGTERAFAWVATQHKRSGLEGVGSRYVPRVGTGNYSKDITELAKERTCIEEERMDLPTKCSLLL
jgi:hypothetical protein